MADTSDFVLMMCLRLIFSRSWEVEGEIAKGLARGRDGETLDVSIWHQLFWKT
jgi:hypothetical protein